MVFYFDVQCPEGSEKWIVYMGRDKHENENLISYGLPHDIWFHVEDMSSAHVYLRPPASLSFPPLAAAASALSSAPATKQRGKAKNAASSSSPPPSSPDAAAGVAGDGASPSGRGGADGESGGGGGDQQQRRSWDDVPASVLSDCCQLVKHNSISGSKASSVDVVYTPWSNLRKTDRMDVGQVGFHDNSNIRLEKNVKTDRDAVKRIEKTRREVAKPDLAGEKEAFDLEVTRARKAAAAARKQEEKEAAAAAAAAKEARSYDKLLTADAMTTPAEVAAKYASAADFEDDFM